jgi:hypothetical protein
MNEYLLESIHNVGFATNFIFINVNKVITIDNISWIFLHLYVVQGWKQFRICATIERVGDN